MDLPIRQSCFAFHDYLHNIKSLLILRTFSSCIAFVPFATTSFNANHIFIINFIHTQTHNISTIIGFFKCHVISFRLQKFYCLSIFFSLVLLLFPFIVVCCLFQQFPDNSFIFTSIFIINISTYMYMFSHRTIGQQMQNSFM